MKTEKVTLLSFKFNDGMCNFLAQDFDQSIGSIFPKLPVIVHHILKKKVTFNYR